MKTTHWLICVYGVQIGYWIGKEFWGRGVMTEAVRQFVQVGWWSLFSRRSVSASGVSGCSQYAFDVLGYQRLEAGCYAHNRASARVLEVRTAPALGCCCVALTLAPYPPFSFFHMHAQKCGFTYEGRLRKSVKKDGKFLDQLLYGLLRSDIADAPDA